MSRRILKQDFFNRPTVEVAKNLLGKFLVRSFPHKSALKAHVITEVEVYDGFRDKGSHASRGKTKRNFPMFGPPGVWYVYFTYGMHWMLNIVTREEGYPAAVLIRSVAGIRGPGRLTKFFHIDGRLSGRPATQTAGLWVEDRGVRVPSSKVKRGHRVGIHYAGTYWAKRRWRFWFDIDQTTDNNNNQEGPIRVLPRSRVLLCMR